MPPPCFTPQESAPPTLAAASAPGADVVLDDLTLELGPDLRALFPVVLNVGVSGQLTLAGRPDPGGLQPSGVMRLDSGVLNLVATQFALARDHANSLTFSPETGLDPLIDLALVSADLRASIQVGGLGRAPHSGSGIEIAEAAESCEQGRLWSHAHSSPSPCLLATGPCQQLAGQPHIKLWGAQRRQWRRRWRPSCGRGCGARRTCGRRGGAHL